MKYLHPGVSGLFVRKKLSNHVVVTIEQDHVELFVKSFTV